MRAPETRLGIALLLFVAFTFFFSCAGHRPQAPPLQDPQAAALLARIAAANSDLKTFKGLGRIRFTENGQLQSGRAAWAGAEANKLRIEILNVTGHFIASLASDGKWLYLNLPSQKRFYKKRAGQESLKSLLKVPISVSEAVSFLKGQVPVCEHDRAVLTTDEQTGPVLVLSRKWSGVCERIYLDTGRSQVRRLEMFDRQGGLAYSVQLEKWETVEGFAIPKTLIFSSSSGDAVRLDIEKLWVNMPLTPSVFVLTPPTKGSEQ